MPCRLSVSEHSQTTRAHTVGNVVIPCAPGTVTLQTRASGLTNHIRVLAKVAALGSAGQEAAQVAVRCVQLVLQVCLQRLRVVWQPHLWWKTRLQHSLAV